MANKSSMKSLSKDTIFNHNERDERRDIKRRIRIGEKYHHVTNAIRKELILRVENGQEKIIQVAKELKIKYSTAKSILKVYRSEGRVRKIPRSQRYFYLRNATHVDKEAFSIGKREVLESRAEKPKLSQPLRESNKNPSYKGPQTRLRTSKKSCLIKNATKTKDEDYKNKAINFKTEEDVEKVELPVAKKLFKGITTDVAENVTRQKINQIQSERPLVNKDQHARNEIQNIQNVLAQQKQLLLLTSLCQSSNTYAMPMSTPENQAYLSLHTLMRAQSLISSLNFFNST